MVYIPPGLQREKHNIKGGGDGRISFIHYIYLLCKSEP